MVLFCTVGYWKLGCTTERYVWRTGYIAARERAPFTTVFGSMVADRLADTLTVLILLLLTFIPAGAQLREYLGQSGV